MKRWIIACCLAAVLLLGLAWSAQTRPTYEYKFVLNASEQKTNEMAGQGWELVTIGTSSLPGGGVYATYVFRREKK